MVRADQGFWSSNHTPAGRGFDESFGFMLGESTHDTRGSQTSHTCKTSIKDLYNTTQVANASALAFNNLYSSYVYGNLSRDIIHRHARDYPNTPMFLYYASQARRVRDPPSMASSLPTTPPRRRPMLALAPVPLFNKCHDPWARLGMILRCAAGHLPPSPELPRAVPVPGRVPGLLPTAPEDRLASVLQRDGVGDGCRHRSHCQRSERHGPCSQHRHRVQQRQRRAGEDVEQHASGYPAAPVAVAVAWRWYGGSSVVALAECGSGGGGGGVVVIGAGR